MSRVGLIDEPLSGQLNASVENAYLIGPGAALSDASADFELEVLSEFLLVMVQLCICPKSSEVVAVNDDTDITSPVVEAGRRCCTSYKPNGLKSALAAGSCSRAPRCDLRHGRHSRT